MIKFIVEPGEVGWNVFSVTTVNRKCYEMLTFDKKEADKFRDQLEREFLEGKIYKGETLDDGKKRVALTEDEFHNYLSGIIPYETIKNLRELIFEKEYSIDQNTNR